MLDVDDTRIAVTDSGGDGDAVVYLNGSYADQRHWSGVIAELGDARWRHLTFDERARGRSERSADYSFEACIRDLDAVLTARGVERPILVGWSYGAAVAAHWAQRYPNRVAGIVSVDGALPFGITGAEAQERIRSLFRRMRWLFPMATWLGLAARMSAEQHAEINIEINEITASIAPTLEKLSCPTRFVLATGGNLGGGDEEMEAARESLDPLLVTNPNLKVSAKVKSNHSKVVKNHSDVIAATVREVAAASAR